MKAETILWDMREREAIFCLRDEWEYSVQLIAKLIGRSHDYVSRRLRRSEREHAYNPVSMAMPMPYIDPRIAMEGVRYDTMTMKATGRAPVDARHLTRDCGPGSTGSAAAMCAEN